MVEMVKSRRCARRGGRGRRGRERKRLHHHLRRGRIRGKGGGDVRWRARRKRLTSHRSDGGQRRRRRRRTRRGERCVGVRRMWMQDRRARSGTPKVTAVVVATASARPSVSTGMGRQRGFRGSWRSRRRRGQRYASNGDGRVRHYGGAVVVVDVIRVTKRRRRRSVMGTGRG